MARNNFQVLLPSTNLASSGTLKVDYDLKDVENLKIMIELTYQATAGTTNCSLNLLYGFGNADSTATLSGVPYVVGGSSVPVFGDTKTPVTMETVTPSSGTPVTVRTVFYLANAIQTYPRWLRLQFVNLDGTNACSIKVYGDL